MAKLSNQAELTVHIGGIEITQFCAVLQIQELISVMDQERIQITGQKVSFLDKTILY